MVEEEEEVEGRSVLMKYISFLLSDFFVLLSRQLHNFIFNVYDEGDLISSLKGSKMIAFSISVVSMHSSFKAFRSFCFSGKLFSCLRQARRP